MKCRYQISFALPLLNLQRRKQKTFRNTWDTKEKSQISILLSLLYPFSPCLIFQTGFPKFTFTSPISSLLESYMTAATDIHVPSRMYFKDSFICVHVFYYLLFLANLCLQCIIKEVFMEKIKQPIVLISVTRCSFFYTE